MTTTSFTVVPYNGSDAFFRAWGSAISDALDTIGLTLVDTNINWSTVTRAALNTEAGYETWRLDNPLTGATDVFIRIGYGTAGGTQTPQMWVTTASGNAGGGTLSGTQSAQVTVFRTGTTSTDTGTRHMLASSDGHGFTLALYDGTITNFTLVVDRCRREDGAAQPRSGWPDIGHARWLNQRTNVGRTRQVATVDPVAGEAVTVPGWPSVSRYGLTNLTPMLDVDGNMLMWPHQIPTRQGTYLSMMMLGFCVADVSTPLNTLTVDHLGGSHDFLTLPLLPSSTEGVAAFCDIYGTAGSNLALWWE